MGGRRSEITQLGNIVLGLPESTLNFFESISKVKLNSLQKNEEAPKTVSYKTVMK